MKQKYVVIFFYHHFSIFISGQTEFARTVAPDGKYPYQAALRVRSRFLCGASIINRRWLLTAGHCVKRIKVTQDASVMVGTNKSNDDGLVYFVSHLIAHPDYDKKHVHANDIALVRTALDIEFSDKVKPIRLPKGDSRGYENTTVVLAGWGSLPRRREASLNLRHIKLRIIGHEACAKAWREKRNRTIAESQICTTGIVKKNVATHGDSGSALVMDGVQIGLGSFAFKDLPDVYSRVDKYLPWILRYVWL